MPEFIPFILPALVVAPAIFGEMEVGKVSEAQGSLRGLLAECVLLASKP